MTMIAARAISVNMAGHLPSMHHCDTTLSQHGAARKRAMTGYPEASGEQPEDDRPRRPTPCSECGSREITPDLICAGCGWWRDDLEEDATLTEDIPMGWEVWNGSAWEYELPYTHSDPPPIAP